MMSRKSQLLNPARPAAVGWRSPRQTARATSTTRPAPLSALRPAPLPAPVAPASEGTAVVPARPVLPSLATLLVGHILHDGEVVLLILKPSRWMILFSSMRFTALAAIFLIAAQLWGDHRFLRGYAEVAALAVAGRVMWSVLQWMGRLYVLTDYRIVRLAGVFGVEVFDCPLRKVRQTRLVRSFRERLWSLGSIEILPAAHGHEPEPMQPAVWQTVRRPERVHEQIRATIARAKNGGGGGGC